MRLNARLNLSEVKLYTVFSTARFKTVSDFVIVGVLLYTHIKADTKYVRVSNPETILAAPPTSDLYFALPW